MLPLERYAEDNAVDAQSRDGACGRQFCIARGVAHESRRFGVSLLCEECDLMLDCLFRP